MAKERVKIVKTMVIRTVVMKKEQKNAVQP